jgi:hypothetical protein
MFQAETRTDNRLQLVQGRKERSRTLKGARTMNEYKFAEYPNNESVASGVTFLVSAWFLLSAGAIIADPTSPYTQAPAVQARAGTVTVAQLTPAPDTHFTITVEAKRLKV